MTIKSSRVVIADLNSEFNEILEEKNDRMFFLRIARYGKYVSDNEVLMKIISPLYKESKKDIISFGEAWKQFYEEWKPLAKDLLEKAGKAGLKETHPLQNEIAELKRRLENATVSYDHDELYYFYRPYFELIQRFKDAGKEKLIADKHLEESGSKFTIELNKTEGEWEKFKSLREISVWWAHYKIELLACVVYSEAYKNAYFDSNRMLDAIYKYEIERLGKDRSYIPSYLKRFDYEKWIKRLHHYLIPRAESFDYNNSLDSKSEIDIIGTLSKRDHDVLPKVFRKEEKDAVANSPAKNELVCGKLRVDLDQGVIHYGNNNPVEISPDNNIVKLLVVLMQSRKIAEYTEIAKNLEINCWHEGTTNREVSREVQFLKRDLITFLRDNVHMTNKEIKEMIVAKKNLGYKLRCV